MGKFKDLTGQQFGELVAIKPTNRRSGHDVMWDCLCSCGQHALINAHHLRSNSTRSCGHLVNLDKASKANHRGGTDLGKIKSHKPLLDSKSGIRGVSWDKAKGKWLAQLVLQGERKLYKRFTNKQDAIDARREAEEKYFKPIIEKYSENK